MRLDEELARIIDEAAFCTWEGWHVTDGSGLRLYEPSETDKARAAYQRSVAVRKAMDIFKLLADRYGGELRTLLVDLETEQWGEMGVKYSQLRELVAAKHHETESDDGKSGGG